MAKKKTGHHYLLCVKNEAYPTSLDVLKVYRTLPDPVAEAKQFVRVVDESGEDYLYPAAYFVAIELPQAALDLVGEAS